MEIRNTINLLGNLLVPENQKPVAEQQKSKQRDSVTLSGQKPNPQRQGQDVVPLQKRTQLLSETIEKNEKGFRRTQEFLSKDGRKFARIEDVTTSPNRTRRTVVQQNTSGNTTILEDILDRQEDGTFRLTRRFTDETGTTKTNIEFNVTPESRNIILGKTPDPEQENQQAYESQRGSQFDVSA